MSYLIDVFNRWRSLAEAGVTVSISHGPSEGLGPLWMVLVQVNGSVSKPTVTSSFQQCIEIAESEARRHVYRNGGAVQAANRRDS